MGETVKMATLKDCVSRFEMSPQLRRQESYITTILKWMQDNPEQLKRTTMSRMARTMKLGNVTPQTEVHIRQTLHNMSTRGMLTYAGGKGRAKKTFFINYLHKNIPKEIIERAPKKDIKKHEELAGIKLLDEKKADEVTVLPMKEEPDVVPMMKEQNVNPLMEKPLAEALTVTPDASDIKPEPQVLTEVPNIPPTPAAPTLDVPIELDKMPNGNFTLQLNINFTINSKG